MFESTVVIRSPSKFLLIFLKDMPLGPFYLMYLLMTFALLSSPRDICWRYNSFPTEISTNIYIVLQSDINSLCGWCAANHIKVKTNKTGVVTFTSKNNAISNNYKLCDKCVTRTHSIKDLGILLDIKLFHHHVDYVFSQSLKMLGVRPTWTGSPLLLIVQYCYIAP
jgi:hypothetical protein